MVKIVVTQEDKDAIDVVESTEGIFGLPVSSDFNLERDDGTYSAVYVATDPAIGASASNVAYTDAQAEAAALARYPNDEKSLVQGISSTATSITVDGNTITQTTEGTDSGGIGHAFITNYNDLNTGQDPFPGDYTVRITGDEPPVSDSPLTTLTNLRMNQEGTSSENNTDILALIGVGTIIQYTQGAITIAFEVLTVPTGLTVNGAYSFTVNVIEVTGGTVFSDLSEDDTVAATFAFTPIPDSDAGFTQSEIEGFADARALVRYPADEKTLVQSISSTATSITVDGNTVTQSTGGAGLTVEATTDIADARALARYPADEKTLVQSISSTTNSVTVDGNTVTQTTDGLSTQAVTDIANARSLARYTETEKTKLSGITSTTNSVTVEGNTVTQTTDGLSTSEVNSLSDARALVRYPADEKTLVQGISSTSNSITVDGNTITETAAGQTEAQVETQITDRITGDGTETVDNTTHAGSTDYIHQQIGLNTQTPVRFDQETNYDTGATILQIDGDSSRMQLFLSDDILPVVNSNYVLNTETDIFTVTYVGPPLNIGGQGRRLIGYSGPREITTADLNKRFEYHSDTLIPINQITAGDNLTGSVDATGNLTLDGTTADDVIQAYDATVFYPSGRNVYFQAQNEGTDRGNIATFLKKTDAPAGTHPTSPAHWRYQQAVVAVGAGDEEITFVTEYSTKAYTDNAVYDFAVNDAVSFDLLEEGAERELMGVVSSPVLTTQEPGDGESDNHVIFTGLMDADIQDIISTGYCVFTREGIAARAFGVPSSVNTGVLIVRIVSLVTDEDEQTREAVGAFDTALVYPDQFLAMGEYRIAEITNVTDIHTTSAADGSTIYFTDTISGNLRHVALSEPGPGRLTRTFTGDPAVERWYIKEVSTDLETPDVLLGVGEYVVEAITPDSAVNYIFEVTSAFVMAGLQTIGGITGFTEVTRRAFLQDTDNSLTPVNLIVKVYVATEIHDDTKLDVTDYQAPPLNHIISTNSLVVVQTLGSTNGFIDFIGDAEIAVNNADRVAFGIEAGTILFDGTNEYTVGIEVIGGQTDVFAISTTATSPPANGIHIHILVSNDAFGVSNEGNVKFTTGSNGNAIEANVDPSLLGGDGVSIPITGTTGDNIIGLTVDGSNNLTGAERGTVETSYTAYADNVVVDQETQLTVSLPSLGSVTHEAGDTLSWPTGAVTPTGADGWTYTAGTGGSGSAGESVEGLLVRAPNTDPVNAVGLVVTVQISVTSLPDDMDTNPALVATLPSFSDANSAPVAITSIGDYTFTGTGRSSAGTISAGENIDLSLFESVVTDRPFTYTVNSVSVQYNIDTVTVTNFSTVLLSTSTFFSSIRSSGTPVQDDYENNWFSGGTSGGTGPFNDFTISGTPTTTLSVPKWTADNTLAWSEDNGGSSIPLTGTTGDNIIGLTVDGSGNLTGAERGTIETTHIGYADDVIIADEAVQETVSLSSLGSVTHESGDDGSWPTGIATPTGVDGWDYTPGLGSGATTTVRGSLTNNTGGPVNAAGMVVTVQINVTALPADMTASPFLFVQFPGGNILENSSITTTGVQTITDTGASFLDVIEDGETITFFFFENDVAEQPYTYTIDSVSVQYDIDAVTVVNFSTVPLATSTFFSTINVPGVPVQDDYENHWLNVAQDGSVDEILPGPTPTVYRDTGITTTNAVTSTDDTLQLTGDLRAYGAKVGDLIEIAFSEGTQFITVDAIDATSVTHIDGIGFNRSAGAVVSVRFSVQQNLIQFLDNTFGVQPVAVGGGAHTIENSTGTELTQRDSLQFTGTGVTVSDDSANDRTIINITAGTGDGGDGSVLVEGTSVTNPNFIDDTTNTETTVGVDFTSSGSNISASVNVSSLASTLDAFSQQGTPHQFTYGQLEFRGGLSAPIGLATSTVADGIHTFNISSFSIPPVNTIEDGIFAILIVNGSTVHIHRILSIVVGATTTITSIFVQQQTGGIVSGLTPLSNAPMRYITNPTVGSFLPTAMASGSNGGAIPNPAGVGDAIPVTVASPNITITTSANGGTATDTDTITTVIANIGRLF